MKVTMIVGLVLDFDDEALKGDLKLDRKEMFENGKVKVLKASMKMTETETRELIHEGDITKEIKDVLGSL